jgi:hypothetical protein
MRRAPSEAESPQPRHRILIIRNHPELDPPVV